MTLKDCFSDQYRTRDGAEVFTFHFQRQPEGDWFFSYARTPSSKLAGGENFVVSRERFTGNTLADLRVQAAEFSERERMGEEIPTSGWRGQPRLLEFRSS